MLDTWIMCPLPCAHPRKRRLRHPQRAEQVGFHLLARFLFAEFFDGSELSVTRVVDHHVQTPEPIVTLFYGFGNRRSKFRSHQTRSRVSMSPSNRSLNPASSGLWQKLEAHRDRF